MREDGFESWSGGVDGPGRGIPRLSWPNEAQFGWGIPALVCPFSHSGQAKSSCAVFFYYFFIFLILFF